MFVVAFDRHNKILDKYYYENLCHYSAREKWISDRLPKFWDTLKLEFFNDANSYYIAKNPKPVYFSNITEKDRLKELDLVSGVKLIQNKDNHHYILSVYNTSNNNTQKSIEFDAIELMEMSEKLQKLIKDCYE